MLDDWKTKYTIKNNSVYFGGKEIRRYKKICEYGIHYDRDSIHILVEENGKYRWVNYGKNGELLSETKEYNNMKIIGRNLYKADGMVYQLSGGKEINLTLETVVRRHDRENGKYMKKFLIAKI